MLKGKRWLFGVAFLWLAFSSTAQVVLPRLVRDSMVLQRDTRVKIWGWASPGEKVTLQFRNQRVGTSADEAGKWEVYLAPMRAGGPFTMRIRATNQIELKDVLVGDVFVCAGQSNMVHQLELHKERYEADIEGAKYPLIRHFKVPTAAALGGPQNDLPGGTWEEANPKNVLQFSVVAYFFAKAIHEEKEIPIGLINASVGGPGIESWISEEGLKPFPPVTHTIAKNKDTSYLNTRSRAAVAAERARPRPVAISPAETTRPFDTTYVPKGWRKITVPGYWEDQGIRSLDGIVWYRKEFEGSAASAGKEGKLALGRIVDADEVYLNGRLVGQTSYQYPQRRYIIPAGLLKRGKNYLVVKVVNYGGKGGFVPDKRYELTAGGVTADLKGDWQYQVAAAFVSYNPEAAGFSMQDAPAALFNAMIAPLAPYAVKGVLWYQGEGNISNAAQYGAFLKALIGDWRKQWNSDRLPFLYVQLPNYDDVVYLPTESPWAVLRNEQLKTLEVPRTGMVVTMDLGEWNDIHPGRKKEIGERLARAAFYEIYGDKQVVPYGPLFQSATIEGNKILISFRHTGGGLVTIDGAEPGEFSIAGSDRKFVWAKAHIMGDKVVVWSDAINAPLYVRYAWADNPANPNLRNKEGLLASPFKTD